MVNYFCNACGYIDEIDPEQNNFKMVKPYDHNQPLPVIIHQLGMGGYFYREGK